MIHAVAAKQVASDGEHGGKQRTSSKKHRNPRVNVDPMELIEVSGGVRQSGKFQITS